jgi:hypothetical protein
VPHLSHERLRGERGLRHFAGVREGRERQKLRHFAQAKRVHGRHADRARVRVRSAGLAGLGGAGRKRSTRQAA